jgi:hypothetical protein
MMNAIAAVLFALGASAPQAPSAPATPPAPSVPPASPEALAPPAMPPFTQAVRLDLGLASAIGFLGVTYSLSPVRAFIAELGVGAGYSGLQLSVMPKLVLGASAHRFVVGAGASVGIPGLTIVTNNGPFGGNQHEHVIAPWINAELGYDYRSTTGSTFLVAGGVTVGLGHGCVVSLDSCAELHGLVLPQLRVGFGRWF